MHLHPLSHRSVRQCGVPQCEVGKSMWTQIGVIWSMETHWQHFQEICNRLVINCWRIDQRVCVLAKGIFWITDFLHVLSRPPLLKITQLLGLFPDCRDLRPRQTCREGGDQRRLQAGRFVSDVGKIKI